MKDTGRIKTLAAAMGMLLLILDSRTALQGAGEGLELCLRTVIPSLFPFFVLSALLTGSLGGNCPGWLVPLGKLTGIPGGAETILLAGCLGGYPIGAKSVADAVKRVRLDPRAAARMMAFCNNAGPSFIFGIAGAMFDERWVGWALWGIQLVSALAVGAILPGKSGGSIGVGDRTGGTLPGAVGTAIGAIAGVCGWVVIFRVLLAFLDRWALWLLPSWVRVLACGLLELTNGCCLLGEIPNPGARFVTASGLLVFGGLCVGMQTASVSEGVSLRWYLPGKLLQTLLAVILALSLQELFPAGSKMPVHPTVLPGIFILAGVGVVFRKKWENSGGISAHVGV